MKARTKKLRTTVTIREIEGACPCAGEYANLLVALKSNPVDVTLITAFGLPAPRHFKTPQYGVDDPINLAAIMQMKAPKGGGYDGVRRVQWMLENVKELAPVTAAIQQRYDQTIAEAERRYVQVVDAARCVAMQGVLGA